MDELMEALEKLFNSSGIGSEVEKGCFQSGELVDNAEKLCNTYLITENGGCNWANINILRANGYSVFAGEKDEFGWLTGCVRRRDDYRTLVYG